MPVELLNLPLSSRLEYLAETVSEEEHPSAVEFEWDIAEPLPQFGFASDILMIYTIRSSHCY